MPDPIDSTERASHEANSLLRPPHGRDNTDVSSAVLISDSLSKGQVVTRYARDTGPFILAGSVGVLSHFISSLYLSRLGEDALAASPLMLLSESLIDSVAMFLLSGMTIKIAACSVGDEKHKVGEIFRQGFLLSLILCIPAVTASLLAGNIMLLLGQPRNIARDVSRYFTAYAPGMPALILMNAEVTTLVGLKHTKPALAVSVLQLAMVAGLGYLLILGKLGFPKMGITGFGIIRSITAWISFFCLLGYLALNPKYSPYKFFQYKLRGTFHWLRDILKIGGPLAILAPAEQAGRLTAMIMVGSLGEDALAAEQVVLQTLSWLIAVAIAGSTITSAHVATAVGSNKHRNARLIGNTEIVMSSIVAIVGAVVFAIIPLVVASLFIPDIKENRNKNLASQIEWLFRIQGLTTVFETVRQLSMGTLKGFADTLDTMLIGIINTTVWLGTGFVLIKSTSSNKLNYFFLIQTIASLCAILPLLLKWIWMSNKAVNDARTTTPVSMFRFFFNSTVACTRRGVDKARELCTGSAVQDDSTLLPVRPPSR